MTTPAVSVSIDRNPQVTIERIFGNGQMTTAYAYPRTFEFRHSRPESNSQPVQVDGFRASTHWAHRQRTFVQKGGTVMVVREGVTPPTLVKSSTFHDGSYWGSAALGEPQPVPGWIKSMVELQALTKLKNQQVNFGVAIAEGQKTVSMMEKTTLHIAASIRNFAKANGRLFRDIVRGRGVHIPRKWLELQYGWSPLLSDLQRTCENLADTLKTDPWITVTSASAWDDVRSVRRNGVGYGAYLLIGRRQNSQCRVKLQYLMDNPDISAFSSLGLINPLAIAWELVPYSFVLDWLVPVGDWLGALDADFGLKFRDGYYSEKTVAEGYIEGGSLGRSPGQSISGSFPVIRDTLEYYTRTKYSSTPVPALYVKSPISLTRVANALSLLATALHRRQR